MQFQIRGARERRVALLARVRFAAGVNAAVLEELAAASESFQANGALVRLVAGVDAQVEPETLLYLEHLVAVVADEDLFALQTGGVFGDDVIFEGA